MALFSLTPEPGVFFSRYGELKNLIETYRQHRKTVQEISEWTQLITDLGDDAKKEISKLLEQQNLLEQQLEQQLAAPPDPNNQRDAIIEIVPGVGGDESALFVEILFDLYSKYIKSQKWEIELLDLQKGNQGGFKYLAFVIKGAGAYGKFKFESGTHKIQRISPTDSAKRMQTSAAMVIVFPEIENIKITINKSDVRVDRFRSGGPGGQAVNRIETGIRLTHVPTGICVRCEGRSQHQNLERAWQILSSRIDAVLQEKLESEQAQQRKKIVGTGDRSQRVRTYNFPQNRVTDHRNSVSAPLDKILSGHLDLLTNQ